MICNQRKKKILTINANRFKIMENTLKNFLSKNGLVSENSNDIYRNDIYAENEKKLGRKMTDREKSRYRAKLRKNLQDWIAAFQSCKTESQKKEFKSLFEDYAQRIYTNTKILYGSSKSAEKSAEIDKFVSALEKIK